MVDRRDVRALVAVAMGIVILGGCATTPAPSGAYHAPADVHNAVVAVAEDLFEAMRTKDADAMRQLFMPEIAMIVASNAAPVSVYTGPPAPFIDRVVGSPGELQEVMWDPEVRVDGDLATLWAPYDFHIDGVFSHDGFDSLQLVRVDGRWRIASVAFTRRVPARVE